MNILQTSQEHEVLKIKQKIYTFEHFWTLVFATLIEGPEVKFLLMLVWHIYVTYLELM